ncbi:MAG: hypothetical protein GXY41_00170 [Phycisphaerae bacterium]|nr:hypothetical protein [Phycisphaerae bacterium]
MFNAILTTAGAEDEALHKSNLIAAATDTGQGRSKKKPHLEPCPEKKSDILHPAKSGLAETR